MYELVVDANVHIIWYCCWGAAEHYQTVRIRRERSSRAHPAGSVQPSHNSQNIKFLYRESNPGHLGESLVS